MDIIKSLTKNLNGHIFSFCEKISQEHNISLEEILNMWCEQQNISYTNVFMPMLKLSKKQQKKSISIDTTTLQESFIEEDFEELETPKSSDYKKPTKPTKVSELQETSKLCEYIFTRGPKKDKQCTIMAKSGSLCSKHKLPVK